MKLTYFYATIEVAPRDGYNESLQCTTDRNDSSKLKFTFPYGEITPEQAAAVAEFTKTLTDAYNVLQSQINRVNKKLKLEKYVPIATLEESASKVSPESVPSQPSHGGSDSTDLVEHSQQEQERLDMEELGTEESEEDTGL